MELSVLSLELEEKGIQPEQGQFPVAGAWRRWAALLGSNFRRRPLMVVGKTGRSPCSSWITSLTVRPDVPCNGSCEALFATSGLWSRAKVLLCPLGWVWQHWGLLQVKRQTNRAHPKWKLTKSGWKVDSVWSCCKMLCGSMYICNALCGLRHINSRYPNMGCSITPKDWHTGIQDSWFRMTG